MEVLPRGNLDTGQATVDVLIRDVDTVRISLLLYLMMLLA